MSKTTRYREAQRELVEAEYEAREQGTEEAKAKADMARREVERLRNS